MSQSLNQIIEAAVRKFGKVKAANEIGNDVVLMIQRDKPVFEDRPYMTIRAYLLNAAVGAAAFEFCHYDLNADEALEDFQQRCARLQKSA